MRTLLLLRHAKSAWDQPLPDHDRPLAARGIRDAGAVGRLLAARGWSPDLVLCSTALRTRQTWQRATEAGAGAAEVRWTERIYEASATGLQRLVAGTDPDVATLMLIGHGPGLPDLAEQLTGALPERFRTSGLARIELDVAWPEVASDLVRGRLASFDVARG